MVPRNVRGQSERSHQYNDIFFNIFTRRIHDTKILAGNLNLGSKQKAKYILQPRIAIWDDI